MKPIGNYLISLGAPFLILLAVFGLLQREGREKVQALPAGCVGGGLIITSAIRRKNRRKMLLLEILHSNKDQVE